MNQILQWTIANLAIKRFNLGLISVVITRPQITISTIPYYFQIILFHLLQFLMSKLCIKLIRASYWTSVIKIELTSQMIPYCFSSYENGNLSFKCHIVIYRLLKTNFTVYH